MAAVFKPETGKRYLPDQLDRAFRRLGNAVSEWLGLAADYLWTGQHTFDVGRSAEVTDGPIVTPVLLKARRSSEVFPGGTETVPALRIAQYTDDSEVNDEGLQLQALALDFSGDPVKFPGILIGEGSAVLKFAGNADQGAQFRLNITFTAKETGLLFYDLATTVVTQPQEPVKPLVRFDNLTPDALTDDPIVTSVNIPVMTWSSSEGTDSRFSFQYAMFSLADYKADAPDQNVKTDPHVAVRTGAPKMQTQFAVTSISGGPPTWTCTAVGHTFYVGLRITFEGIASWQANDYSVTAVAGDTFDFEFAGGSAVGAGGFTGTTGEWNGDWLELLAFDTAGIDASDPRWDGASLLFKQGAGPDDGRWTPVEPGIAQLWRTVTPAPPQLPIADGGVIVFSPVAGNEFATPIMTADSSTGVIQLTEPGVYSATFVVTLEHDLAGATNIITMYTKLGAAAEVAQSALTGVIELAGGGQGSVVGQTVISGTFPVVSATPGTPLDVYFRTLTVGAQVVVDVISGTFNIERSFG